VRGVLFDLDGTLWDAVAAITPAWNRVLAGYGKSVTAEDMAGIMGLTDREIAARFLPELPPGEGTAAVHRAAAEEAVDLYRGGGRLYPAVAETLRALRGRYALFVVSNCMDGYVGAFLHAHGLEDVFTDCAWLGHPARDKAANIAALLARYPLEGALYVGDTAGDGAAARAAGIPFLQAAYGFGAPAERDGVLERFADLPEVLAGFWKD